MGYDPDFGKRGFARDLFRLRFRRLRIDQPTFAARFGLSFGMVKDQEQSRGKPSRAFKVLDGCDRTGSGFDRTGGTDRGRAVAGCAG